MDISPKISLSSLLFESDPHENLVYEFDLQRNESEFQSFLDKISQNPELSITSLSLSFLAKKWAGNFFKNLNEIAKKGKNFEKLLRLRISNTNIPTETLIELLKNMRCRPMELNLSSNPLTISDLTVSELTLLDSLKNLRVLILKNNKKITDETLSILSFPELTCLNLSNCSITDPGLASLNQNQNLQKIEVLNLSRNHEIQLFQKVSLSKLEVLEVAYCKLQPQFVKNLVSSGLNLKLKTLNIGNLASYDTKAVFQEIVKEIKTENSLFPSVEKLNLENVCIDDSDVALLLGFFPNCKALNLSNNKFLTGLCLKDLEGKFGDLRVLALENCQISTESIEKGLTYRLDKIEYLNLNNNCDLGDKGLRIILERVGKNLEYLFCANCSLTYEISTFFKELSPTLPNLQYLNLRGNQSFYIEGLEILARCQFFAFLKFLNLSDTGLSEDSVKVFLQNKPENGYKLKDFRLAQNKITPEAMKVLFQNFQKDFQDLERFAMGSYECMEDFEGKKEMEQKGVLVVGMIGDNFD